MAQENKELLLKDLCARLPYKVIVKYKSREKEGEVKITCGNIGYVAELGNGWWKECKPYLRPMSSMTEEESNELESITFPLMEKDWDANENPACIRWIDVPKYMDFILSHHFDYQGLIEKGLAIEVTEYNNPYK